MSGLALSGCQAQVQSVLAPASEAAEAIAELWWLMLAIAVAVVLLVVTLFFVAVFRRRAEDGAPPLGTRRFILAGGIVLPLVVLTVLLVLSLGTTASIRGDDDVLTVEVIGHQWWWEVYYPEHHVTTANEIHIPAGRAVRLKLTSGDVIHSFWVPRLNGKMDLVPGKTNTFWIQADAPGVFRGQCAEFCGVQHAKMAMLVIAEPEDAFAAWVAAQQEPAPRTLTPLMEAGQQVFLSSSCVYCHTVRGTNASGQLGPDLTHLASRRTIGAGILPNTKGHLAGWIVNAQAIKPGNLMPPMYLEPDDLQALLAYLAALE